MEEGAGDASDNERSNNADPKMQIIAPGRAPAHNKRIGLETSLQKFETIQGRA